MAIYVYATLHSSARAGFVLATDSWRNAAPIILDGGQGVLPAGGYSSRVPAPTVQDLERLVRVGDLRFILLTGTPRQYVHDSTNIEIIQAWTREQCSGVPQTAYLFHPYDPPAHTPSPEQLFDCSPPPGGTNAGHKSTDPPRPVWP